MSAQIDPKLLEQVDALRDDETVRFAATLSQQVGQNKEGQLPASLQKLADSPAGTGLDIKYKPRLNAIVVTASKDMAEQVLGCSEITTATSLR